ncbi:MAG: Uma2 family endonuclease [Chloroflexi bacterium]|nr:Uma2 family endonuclease [Chloroflexota bacterium]
MIEMKTADVRVRVAPKEKMTFEDFLDWCDEDTHAEWVNGEVQMTSPANDEHQDLADFLTTVLRQFVRQKKLGWIRSAPFLMRLPDSSRGREPDILFVRQEHLARVKKTYLDGPADLAIEIISPESVGRDRGEKFVEYEQAGITEYWLIDPTRARAEFYRLDARGMYRLIDPDANGVYRSQVVDGFWLRVDWLWQDPLPMEEDVLREVRENQKG